MHIGRTLVLVVDDLLGLRRMASARLKQNGFETVEAETVVAAAQAVREIDELYLVVSDLQLQGGTARDLHRQIGTLLQERHGLFVLLTGSRLEDDPKLASYSEYFQEHGVRVMYKPLISWQEDIIPILCAFRDRRAS